METLSYWEETSANSQHVKFESCGSTDGSSRKDDQSIFQYCEGNLNFTTAAANSEDDEFNFHKKKVSRDPMSHRIIEKRRRDRMNNCLADLSRLIPADYLKKGRGRIEKTEIIEMAIKHMKHLQSLACPQLETCELVQEPHQPGPIVLEHYRLGYQECLSEAMHFMVEVEGYYAGDPLCVQLINHLQKHCDKILKGDRLNFPRTHLGETTSTSSGSSNGYGHRSRTVGRSSGLGSSSSPSLGSGSGSDSGAKDPTLEIQSPVVPIGSASEITVDDREELRNSQLRDMLQQQHPLASATPSNTAIPQVDHSSTPSLYKFKNNIKQRFTAERHDVTVPSVGNAYTGAKRARYVSEASEEVGGGTSNLIGLNVEGKRRDSETCSVPSSPPSPKYNTLASPTTDLSSRVTPPPHLRHKAPTVQSQGVPIFALHAKGSFYIPLTLEAEVLAPYLAAIGLETELEGGLSSSPKSVVLHPVTISVNFQQANHQVKVQHLNTFSSNLPWKSESNSFPSMSKWPVCVQDRG